MRVDAVVERRRRTSWRHLVVDVELEQPVVEDSGDGSNTDLTGLLRIHCFQFHSTLELVVIRTLKPHNRSSK